MLIEKMGFDEFLKKRKFFSHIYTLLVVGFGWILFRFENLYVAARYLKRILLPWKYLHSSFSIWEIVNHRACLLAVIGIFGSGIMQQIIKRKPFLQDMKYGKWEVTGCALIVLLSFSLLAGNTYNPFIYFRF